MPATLSDTGRRAPRAGRPRRRPPGARFLGGEKAVLRVAARLGRALRAGDVVCLDGPLGVGKTTFVRGMLRGRGYGRPVTSPTFALVNEYRSRALRVCHMDLYRLTRGEAGGIGLEEYLADPGSASLIEWPAAAAGALPADRLEITLGYPRGGASSLGRTASFRSRGTASRALLRRAGFR